MSNEFFFISDILIVSGFTLVSARLGQNALAACIALQGVLANLFVLKQISLFGLTVTSSDVFAVGCIAGLNLMQEHFGKEAAKKTIGVSFAAMVFFVLASQIHLAFMPSPYDNTDAAFRQILSPSPRIVAASIGVFFIVQRWDIFFFGYLKRLFKDRSLGIRMIGALIASQALDTVLFSLAGLYGIVASVIDCMAVSFTIKCIVAGFSAPIASFAKRFLPIEKSVS